MVPPSDKHLLDKVMQSRKRNFGKKEKRITRQVFLYKYSDRRKRTGDEHHLFQKLVKVNRFEQKPSAQLFSKSEKFNEHKDRSEGAVGMRFMRLKCRPNKSRKST
jgi:hypothetical protein